MIKPQEHDSFCTMSVDKSDLALKCLFFRTEHMMIVAGDYTVNTFEGTEQYAKPHRLVTHPLYNRSTNNADIMLIKVLQKEC